MGVILIGEFNTPSPLRERVGVRVKDVSVNLVVCRSTDLYPLTLTLSRQGRGD
jgi:hypothetical protein